MNMNEFLEEINKIVDIRNQLSKDAIEFYDELKQKSETTFTENGKKIILCMQNNLDKYELFNAKILGELLFMPPRSVSGSIKKLINEGYCEKVGNNPVSYKLTTRGKEVKID